MAKVRADLLLTERGLAPTRTRARALILAGRVFSGERRVEKSGDQLQPDAPLEVRGGDLPYVSRGGLKLEGALDAFAFDPAGLVAADFGASTGGFTDCLLQRGAVKVYAIDVGYGQLHDKMRRDERVVVMERTNARHLTREDIPEPIDLIVVDASFIGLGKLLPAAALLLSETVHRGRAGSVIAMVKPQFEVGRGATKGGVVRDPELRLAAIDGVSRAATELGFVERQRADAAVKGPKGNHEAFLLLELVPTTGAT
jgi:23S rRNA (cytidine1920-2'-O)/16S rRNA (cytidine1409-2'-O)-methyltransferase